MLDLLLALGCNKVRPSKKDTPMSGKSCAHLDPDLRVEGKPGREKHIWRGVFGQSNKAMGHLLNQGVDKGDLFLFYGLFAGVKLKDSKLSYMEQGRHVIWGWLQVDERISATHDKTDDIKKKYNWLCDHPHLINIDHKDINNHIFIARENMEIPGVDRILPGWGVFPHFHGKLVLSDLSPLSNPTAKYLSQWRLPAFFNPFADGKQEKKPLTFHRKPDNWVPDEKDVIVKRTSGYGQEFVLDCTEYQPDITNWLDELFKVARNEAFAKSGLDSVVNRY
jgi:hypothetical protein